MAKSEYEKAVEHNAVIQAIYASNEAAKKDPPSSNW